MSSDINRCGSVTGTFVACVDLDGVFYRSSVYKNFMLCCVVLN
jgi:hypothetical protein